MVQLAQIVELQLCGNNWFYARGLKSPSCLYPMKNRILIILTILTGIFIYKVPKELDLVGIAQFSFMLLSAGLLLSFTIKNKWLACLCALMFVNIFTVLLQNEPIQKFLYSSSILIFSSFCVYNFFVTNKLNPIKWLMLPVILNAVFIYIQRFSPSVIPFKQNITGLLGNAGFSSCFMGLTAPIFLKYFPLGLPFIIGAMVIGNGGTGIVAAVISSLIWLWFNNRNGAYLLILICLLSFFLPNNFLYSGELDFRISSWLGTLDSIRYHWVKGWGVGNFITVMSRVQIKESIYFKVPFNSPTAVLNHPANEFLYGWWNFGILFPILSYLYIEDLVKKFTKEKITLFCILIACFIVAMGFMFTPPGLFVVMMVLGLYENKEVGDG